MGEIKVVTIPTKTESPTPISAASSIVPVQADTVKAVEDFLRGTITEDEYNKLLTEIIVRFNTEPKKYEKEDYRKLIQALVGLKQMLDSGLKSIVPVYSDNEDVLKVVEEDSKNKLSPQVATEINDNDTTSDNQLTTGKLIKEYINNKLNWIQR